MDYSTTLTRMALYDLVWSEPMTALAKKFKISDNGLRKICIKMDIPLPKAGYWMKIKFGKRIKKIGLPKIYSGKDHVTLSPTSEVVKEVYTHLTKQNILRIQIEEELGAVLIVSVKLTKPDKLIATTKAYLNGSISYEDRINHNMQILKINVTKTSYARAFRIMDTLIKALRRRGHSIIFRNGDTHVEIKGQQIKIYLKEKEKRVPNIESKYSWDSHTLAYTGLLYLRIKENCDRQITMHRIRQISVHNFGK